MKVVFQWRTLKETFSFNGEHFGEFISLSFFVVIKPKSAEKQKSYSPKLLSLKMTSVVRSNFDVHLTYD